MVLECIDLPVEDATGRASNLLVANNQLLLNTPWQQIVGKKGHSVLNADWGAFRIAGVEHFLKVGGWKDLRVRIIFSLDLIQNLYDLPAGSHHLICRNKSIWQS